MEAVIVSAPAMIKGQRGDEQPTARLRGHAVRRDDLRSYHQICQDIDRLLDAGQLAPARRLNDEARALFRRLYGASG